MKAFFIDKDGTLVDNSGYPEKIPSDKLLENDVIDGLKKIKNMGYLIIIVSNQPWISKNKLNVEQVNVIFFSLMRKLDKKGAHIDDFFYCPHQSSDHCLCKKPSPGLIHQAVKKYGISLKDSYIVGDMDSDIALGKNLGMKTVLVKTGMGNKFLHTNPDFIIENLNEVGEIWLKE